MALLEKVQQPRVDLIFQRGAYAMRSSGDYLQARATRTIVTFFAPSRRSLLWDRAPRYLLRDRDEVTERSFMRLRIGWGLGDRHCSRLGKMPTPSESLALFVIHNKRTDQPFTVSIGLRRLHRCSQYLQPECFQLIVDLGRENRIPIMNQKSIGMIAGSRFSRLLQGPVASGMKP